ncbi:MAG TPA: PQQ-binding-like beta-propeller repeat protein, partial [Pirellulales bacterium]|nr:PQQ-binding-like beta-propeller repeat protein [Pirellulales bacterium]
ARELGQGYSGFVAEHERVYTQYQTLYGQFVACLDARTGDTLWTYRYDWPYEMTGLYPGPRSTPTLADDHIFFAAPSGLIGCLTKQGGPVWSTNVVKRFQGAGTSFGYACTPVVEGGLVLLTVGGPGASLVALDARDGSTVWQSGDDPASYVPVLPITVEGRRVVVGLLENVLVGCDLATGQMLWRLELSRGYSEHAAWPIYSEPVLWFSGPFQFGSQLLELPSAADGKLRHVWQGRLLSNDVCSSVLDNESLYGFDLREPQSKIHRASRGEFRCLDFRSGKERWSTSETGQSNVLVADGKLILLNDLGELILARADPSRYEQLARATLLGGEICWTAPTLYRSRVYVRSQTRAVCVYVGRPENLADLRERPRQSIATIPQRRHRDLTPLLGVEPEYAFDVPSGQWLRAWFTAGLAILFAATMVACLISALLRMFLGRWPAAKAGKLAFWIVTFLLGAAGTTVLSRWRGDFVFTWPVALFVLFQATVDQIRPAGLTATRWTILRGYLVAISFLGGCVVYYLLCRQLSLVTEWAFLCGFAAALPISVARTRLARRGVRVIMQWPLAVVEFAFYYWSSVAILLWRCQ